MSVSLEEVLMALGSFSVDLTWDPELALELKPARGLLVYEGERLVYGGVTLGGHQAHEGMLTTGVGPEWLLGTDDVGPTLEDKEYVAGNNKLSNPDFAYLGAEQTGVGTSRVTADSWKLADPTGWVITAGHATSTDVLTAGLGLDPDVTLAGDILTSDETFEAKAQNQYLCSVTAQHTGSAIGRLRRRLVYEGHFRHPNLLPSIGSWTIHAFTPGDAYVVFNNFFMGPIHQTQYVSNPGFETGDLAGWSGNSGVDPGMGAAKWQVVDHWDLSSGSILPHSGSRMALAFWSFGSTDETARWLLNAASVSVQPGERYLLEGYINQGPFTIGQAQLHLIPIASGVGQAYIGSPSVEGENFYVSAGHPDNPLSHAWKQVHVEYEVPTTTPQPNLLQVQAWATFTDTGGVDTTLGEFFFDDITLTRTAGNIVRITSPVIAVRSEESYSAKVLVSAGAGTTDGTVGFAFLFQGPGRPDQSMDGALIDAASAASPTLLESPFVVPSGYDRVYVFLVGTDIIGGSFTVGTPTMALTDPTREVHDLVIDPSAATIRAPFTFLSYAPVGTEKVHMEVIADDKGAGWDISHASLSRAETPVTSGAVVHEILTDPLTADELLAAGNIVGPEAITFDWHVLNLTRRAQLQHLSRAGVAEPEREWRVYVDASGTPILDWGTPGAIFTDHTDLVFMEDDLIVLGPPQVEHSAEERVTRVKVVGADRQRPDGPPKAVTGVATNPNTDFLDWFGNPLNRTQTLSESSIDHPDYAASFARYKADRAQVPAENVRVQLSDWRAVGQFNVGDWIYLYKPEAGIEDPSHPVGVNGRTVFPKRLRVISRKWDLGGGDFRLEIHRPGLANYVIPDSLVQWSQATTAEIECGDPLPEFSVDSGGDAAWRQFRRFRHSMPA